MTALKLRSSPKCTYAFFSTPLSFLFDTKKSCVLDPIPTTLAMQVVDDLLPILSTMINMSLESGQFASA